MMRIAMTGASGTGKTTLAEYVAATMRLPLNPVGSRSVAAAMGFASPYDVDKAGKRAEFQQRLLREKMAWEAEHDAFVTDRTVADNLAYLVLHDVRAVDEDLIRVVRDGVRRYTNVFYCPFQTFCAPGGDPARVPDLGYQWAYDAALVGVLSRLGRSVVALHHVDLNVRKSVVNQVVYYTPDLGMLDRV